MEAFTPAHLWSILVFVAWAWPASLIAVGAFVYFVCRKSSGQATLDKALERDGLVISELLSVNKETRAGHTELMTAAKDLIRTAANKPASPLIPKTAAPVPQNGHPKELELVIKPDRLHNGGK